MLKTKIIMYCLVMLTAFRTVVEATYYVGVGRADCTGPAAEIIFMGYANLNQAGCGIHLRQFSRAYVFNDTKTLAAFVSVDISSMNHPLKQAVIDKLATVYGNNTYTLENTIISGTHTHSTPGGYAKDILLDISIMGFVQETFDAFIDGIVRSIIRAHNNQTESRIFINSGELLDTNINRSPASYLYNPKGEQDKYPYNVDKELVQVRIVRQRDSVTIGAINWFAVHPTSMNNTNCLVSSDNVGYASILLESSVNTGSLPGQGDFVGAFASTNLGDVSPNTKGPICIKTGEPCDFEHSTCNGRTQDCIASGPGKDMFESTQIIAENLFKKGKELLEDSKPSEITGDIKYIHRFSHIPSETATIQLENGTKVEVEGCLPALGYAFAAGTTDGPGAFDFTQADNTSNPFWNAVFSVAFDTKKEDKVCHAPKPILLMTGRARAPNEWQPETVTTQLLKIGSLIIAAVPGEFTTMSGRRLRDTILKESIANSGPSNTKVVIAGLSSVYASYVATFEEYQLQRYEGASTIFGPHTLTIYLKLYKELVAAMIQGTTLKSNSTPYKFPEHMMTFVLPASPDVIGLFKKFGDCTEQPKDTYRIGDTVSATFVSGNPRNNLMQEKTFLEIQIQQTDGQWKTVATDADWETKFIWKKVGLTSRAEIQWNITGEVKPGKYRIQHHGYYKSVLSQTYPYSGTSKTFTVTSSQ